MEIVHVIHVEVVLLPVQIAVDEKTLVHHGMDWFPKDIADAVKEVHEHVQDDDDDDDDHVNEEHDLVVLHSSHVDDDVTMAEHERKQMAVHVDDAIGVMHEKNVDHDTK